MAVFEKAVAEVRQGQDAFCNTTTNTINTQPERDITYFNRTLVTTTTTSLFLIFAFKTAFIFIFPGDHSSSHLPAHQITTTLGQPTESSSEKGRLRVSQGGS
jgi:hypothetical protein